MNLTTGIKKISVILLLSSCFVSISHTQIVAGRIVFERRTNLLKRYKDPKMNRFVTEENKIRTDKFELIFNDTASVFKPILSDEPDQMAWLTSKNSYYENSKTQIKISVLSLIGQDVYIKDSVRNRNWKITDNHRTINGYDCRKAIYQKNDSTRLYAWFTTDIVASTGPEGFSGLPGAILGLATEDGGIIYFATSVESTEPKKEVLTPNTGKNKLFSIGELKAKIEKDYGNMPWGKRLFEDLFRWL
jgi:GLPGLI family protein